MLGVILGVGASLGWGSSDFLAGVQSRRLKIWVVLAASQVCAVTLLGLILAVRGTGPGDAAFVPLALTAGAAEVLGIGALYRGLAAGPMGVVAPISATSVIVPVVVGIVSGDPLAAWQVAGISLAIAGVVLASREGTTEGVNGSAGIVPALVAAIGFGIFYVMLKEASRDADTLWVVFVARGALLSIVAVGLAVSRPPLVPGSAVTLLILASAGVLDIAGTTMYATATRNGLLSEVAVAASLYPLVTLTLARLLLKERIRLVQRAGGLMALTGVALVAVR